MRSPAGSLVRREAVLLGVLVGVAVALFFVTRAFAASNERVRLAHAATWFARGQQALAARDTAAAMASFRRAVFTDPARLDYRLALAGALAGSGRPDEAERALDRVLEERPEDAQANLQLARIEAGRGELTESRRHYQSAIAALWRPEQATARRSVRLELIELLLARGEQPRALSELLLLSAQADGPAQPVRLAELFLRAGDPGRALAQSRSALASAPGSEPARLVAGRAAFELGDYAAANRYLGGLESADAADLLAVSGQVLALDPLAPRLGARARAARLEALLARAAARSADCAAQPGSPGARPGIEALEREIDARRRDLRRAASRRDQDLIEDGLALAVRTTTLVDRECGASQQPVDRATRLIARRHQLEEP